MAAVALESAHLSSPPATATAPNAGILRAHDRRERLGVGLLTLPGLLMITLVLLMPMAWLFWLSAFGPDGSLTTENYARMLRPVYVKTFITTFEVSAMVTVLTVLLGYPLAYLLSQLPARAASICLVFVILPFWTSVLVRTYAWMVILQRRGIINTWLVDSGLVSEPLNLVNNMTGTLIGMTHVMLPCLVFPLYAAMKSIDPAYLRAAANCGATPAQAFRQVFLPLSLPGLSAGVILVFVLCLGYYITPALLGGGKVMMWAMQIEAAISMYSNWGAASALGVGLVAVTLVILYVLNRVFGVEKLYGSK